MDSVDGLADLKLASLIHADGVYSFFLSDLRIKTESSASYSPSRETPPLPTLPVHTLTSWGSRANEAVMSKV